VGDGFFEGTPGQDAVWGRPRPGARGADRAADQTVLGVGRVDALAEGLALVLFDTDLRRELRVRGLARAAGFRWAGTAWRLLAVLGEET
jgi:hypothetical protein